MRPVIFSIMLFLLSGTSTAAAQSYVDVPSEDVYSSLQSKYQHLEYMGFYASAMRQWNYTEALAPHTNLTWIEVPKLDALIDRISEARDNNVEAVISLQPFIFDSDFLLKADYPLALAELQERLDFEDLTDHVAMIYPVDEPYLHAGSSTKINRSQMFQNLIAVNREIRALFPKKPIGVIFNNKEVLRRDFKIPNSYRWIGFDCYDNMFDCKEKPFTDYYSTLLDLITPKQFLMAVPQTWVRNRDYERGDFEPRDFYERRLAQMAKDLKKRLRHHYEVALSEPRIIAFIPFIWSLETEPGQPEHSGFGANQFEEMLPKGGTAFLDYLETISDEIKYGSHIYPNLNRQQTEFSFYRPQNKYRGEITEVTDRGWVSGWAINRALPHKALRMQIIVEHDELDVYASNIRRSFIHDKSMPSGRNPDLPEVGIHGYRHRLPRVLMDELDGERVTLKLRVYGDRAEPGVYTDIKKRVTL